MNDGGGWVGRGAGVGGGRFSCCLPSSFDRSLTTHPFRDGAPFLLLIETPPTFGRSGGEGGMEL